MAEQFRCLPSEIMDIDDPYTAFCFNEACSYILLRLRKGDTPYYRIEEQEEEQTAHYTNFKDFYKAIEGG